MFADVREAARKAAREGNFPVAVACFDAASKANPESGENWADLAMANGDAGDHQAAHKALNMAVDPRSKNPPAVAGQMYMVGKGFMQRSMLPEAAVAFEKTTELTPEHGDAWLNLGAMQQSLGMTAEACSTPDPSHCNPNPNLASSTHEESALPQTS